jgi:tetratricopeptide (TPR) repeat protein
MIEKTTYTAFAFLLLSPLFAAAQDEGVDSDDIVVDPSEQTVPVADEEVLAESQQDEVSEERLQAEFARYRVLLQQGTLDEADIAAKRIVEMAIKVYGPQSRETANALNNLGIVQHSNGQFDAAIQNFTSSIEIIEFIADRLNGSLVNPLKGLGAAQLGNGRPDQARKTYIRAAHITQVNEGPHNLGQVEILESIAETYIRMGDPKSARNVLDRIHIINVKHFEQNPLGLLPSLMSRAKWQHRAGYYGEERITYRRAIRIIETGAGKDDPMLVEPLRRLGESFYFIDVTTATHEPQGLASGGELYFKRAARIAEKSETMDWRQRAKTQIVLADYYIFIDSQNRARRRYKQVWDSLSTDDEHLAQRDAWFQNPVAIRAERLPTFAGNAAPGNPVRDDILTGKIIVDYTVSARGRVKDLRTEAFPPEFTDMQRMVHREIRQRAYRPRVVDGIPVETEDIRFEHNFDYSKADLEALRETRIKADEAKKSGNR